MSASAFADTIGISRSGLTHLLTGRNQPSLDVARKILAKFPEISTEWLIMGMGDMFRTESPVAENEVTDVTATPESQHPAENLKFVAQPDLFGEYENPEDSEEVMPVADDEPQPPMEVESVDNEESTITTADSEPSIQPVDVPEPPTTPRTAPVRSQPVPSRPKRTQESRPASSPVRRERHEPVTNQERKLQKIVFFYDDHSFEVYNG